MKNFKRMFSFVKGRYRFLILSLIMIVLVQTLGFISPLIVKQVLDEYLLGIEYDWIEVSEIDEKTVVYNEHYYKQVRYQDDDDIVNGEASIILYKDGFYFTPSRIEDGNKEINGTMLVISNKSGDYLYEVTKLSRNEITTFYHPVTRALISLIIILLVKDIIVIFATYTQHISTNRVVSLMARDGRRAAMSKVERIPIKLFEEEPSGKTASRITTDVDGFIILYRQIINIFASAILSFIFAYVGMFILNYRLALLSFLIYPLAYIWIRIYLRYLKKIAEKVNESRSMLTAKINEIINGINILQVFNFKKQTIDEFNVINEAYKTEQLKEVKLHIIGGWNMLNVVRSLITTLIVLYFGWQYLSFSGIVITAGLIYAYNEYLIKIIAPINIVFTQISEYQHSHVRIERISKLIEAQTEDEHREVIPRYHGDVKFDDVWFAYNDNEYVLKGITFEVKAGQMVGLVGHTGSGKSSLMNLLLRFYDITDSKSGHIYVDGTDINTYSKRTFRQHIGIVLQEPTLFKGTIASNIRFGKEDVTDEELERILISMGGEKLLNKFEKGINQPITRAGVNMSAGEKQIISLARAVVHDPAILIMDEATSHIDTETEEMIKKALKVVCQGRTVIVIAHRLSTIFSADNIVVLEHGLKVEEGTHDELVKNNGVYANIYRAQITSPSK